MNLVFELDNVLCVPNADYLACKPIANAIEFVQFCRKKGHHITIWTQRTNLMEHKIKTERWLLLHQIPYDRLIFDKPRGPVYVDETPSNAKYYQDVTADMYIVASLYEEWKEDDEEWKEDDEEEDRRLRDTCGW